MPDLTFEVRAPGREPRLYTTTTERDAKCQCWIDLRLLGYEVTLDEFLEQSTARVVDQREAA